MATKLGKYITNTLFFRKNQLQFFTSRSIVYAENGTILPKPEQTRFPLVKIILTVVPFLYVGATLSKTGAAFLEENEIFVPDDDDD